jgi:hypothetical protein
MTFKDRLDKLSNKYGSLRKLAIHCKIPYNTLYDYHEKGEAVKVEVVLRLSKHTGCSIDWLLTGIDKTSCTASDICKEACKVCKDMLPEQQATILRMVKALQEPPKVIVQESLRGRK